MGTILKAARPPLSSPSLGPSLLPSRRLSSNQRWRRGPVRGLFHGVVALLVLWEQRISDRDMLRAMNAAQLRDIGLDAAAAEFESEKPFWRA